MRAKNAFKGTPNRATMGAYSSLETSPNPTPNRIIPMRRQSKPKIELGTLRIIGGTHRGRKLQFPALEGVRPTPDRVRETLFNWLAMQTPGAHCLDLFAGSGALGLEALSRGAAEVLFVDAANAIVESLQGHIATLKAENAGVVLSDALRWLKSNQPEQPFDLVFLDPPFHHDLLQPVCALLESEGYLKSQSRIYLEAEAGLTSLPLPPNWEIVRHKQAGQVQYALCIRN